MFQESKQNLNSLHDSTNPIRISTNFVSSSNNPLVQQINLSEIHTQKNQLLLYSSKPIILKSKKILIEKQKRIINNLKHQINSSTANSLILVQLLKEKDKPYDYYQIDNTKISYEIPTKNLSSEVKRDNNMQSHLENLQLSSVIKKQNFTKKQLQVENIADNHIDQNAWALIMFPLHESRHQITHGLPQQIVTLSLNDIFSYQKTQRIAHMKYMLMYKGFQQNVSQKLETEIYYNWGENNVYFKFANKNDKYYAASPLKPGEFIMIPGVWKYKIQSQGQVSKLLSWNILQKKNLAKLIESYRFQDIGRNIPYSFLQFFTDYIFHQSVYIDVQDQPFVYEIINVLNERLMKEIDIIEKDLNMSQSQIQNIGKDKKIDECFKCKGFIFNYLGFYKFQVYCLQCVKQQIAITKLYRKLPKKVFQQGYQLLKRVKGIKDSHEIQYNNKILKNLMFFTYEDLCDGDFIGSYHNHRCKMIEFNNKRPKNSQQTIVRNSINYINKIFGISSALEIVQYYSDKQCGSDLEKKSIQIFNKKPGVVIIQTNISKLFLEKFEIISFPIACQTKTSKYGLKLVKLIQLRTKNQIIEQAQLKRKQNQAVQEKQ